MKTRHFTKKEVREWAGEGVDEIHGENGRFYRTNQYRSREKQKEKWLKLRNK